MLAAARFTVAVNEIVRGIPGRQVGTVGRLTAIPGTVNVIPARVTLTVDLRDLSMEKLAMLSERLQEAAGRIGTESGTTFSFKPLTHSEAALSDPRIRRTIAESARSLGLTCRELPSGAGHDAQELASVAPMGMVFVPSVGGVSHSPRELSRPDDITNGANVLLRTVLTVDRGLTG